MFQLIQVFQRSVLLPFTLVKILTDWLAVIERANDKAVSAVNNEIDNWDVQSQLDSEALADKAIQEQLAEAREQLAKSKAKSKANALKGAAKFK